MTIEVSPVSIDRPFGIYLWSIADTFFGVSRFEFVRGELPFSTYKETFVALIIYYTVIFGGRSLLRNTPRINLDILYKIHNVCLSVFSLILLVLFIEQIFPILARHGLLYAICDSGAWTQPLVTLYYLNYLTKYFELFDTVYMVLRKKPLTFLHTYHHGATVVLCVVQLLGKTSVSWVPVTLNLWVHVTMYWYYFLSACKVRVWWKEWVTRFQIIQFIIDLVFVYAASYTYFSYNYFGLPNFGDCAGDPLAASYGCALLTSYLILFIAFYMRIYNKSITLPFIGTIKLQRKHIPASDSGLDTASKAQTTATESPAPAVTRSRKAL